MKTTALGIFALLLIPALPGSMAQPAPPDIERVLVFHCTNHDPNDVANSPSEVQRLTAEKSCSGWKAVADGQVTGTVRDGDGRLIAGVNVSLRDGSGSMLASSVSDSDGRFTLRGVPLEGRFAADMTAMGYASRRAIVDVADGTISLRLTRQP